MHGTSWKFWTNDTFRKSRCSSLWAQSDELTHTTKGVYAHSCIQTCVMLCCTWIQIWTQKCNCVHVTGSNWTNAAWNCAHCVGARYLKMHLHTWPNTFRTYHSRRFNPFSDMRTRFIPSIFSVKNIYTESNPSCVKILVDVWPCKVLMAIFLICLGIHTSEGLNHIVHSSQRLAIVDLPKGSEIPERNAHRNPLHLLPVA